MIFTPVMLICVSCSLQQYVDLGEIGRSIPLCIPNFICTLLEFSKSFPDVIRRNVTFLPKEMIGVITGEF